MIIAETLQSYFAKYHFADGGYKDSHFRIKIGPLFIPIPNTEARIRAVKIHDIHHILTEYTAFWKGEIEIGAWEIASGCGKHYVAWILNFGSFTVGLFLYPRALFKAFMKGKTATTNLYHGYEYDTKLLQKSVGELRKEIGMDQIIKNKTRDYFHFLGWAFIAMLLPLSILLAFCEK